MALLGSCDRHTGLGAMADSIRAAFGFKLNSAYVLEHEVVRGASNRSHDVAEYKVHDGKNDEQEERRCFTFWSSKARNQKKGMTKVAEITAHNVAKTLPF